MQKYKSKTNNQTNRVVTFESLAVNTTNYYNDLIRQGNEYLEQNNFENKRKDAVAAAIEKNDFPHWYYLTKIGLHVVGGAADIGLTLVGGRHIQQLNYLFQNNQANILQNNVEVAKSAIFWGVYAGVEIAGYANDYNKHKKEQNYIKASNALSNQALNYFYDAYVRAEGATDFSILSGTYGFLTNPGMSIYLNEEDYKTYTAMKDDIYQKYHTAAFSMITDNQAVIEGKIISLTEEQRKTAQALNAKLDHYHHETLADIHKNREIVLQNQKMLEELQKSIANQDKKLLSIEKTLAHLPKEIAKEVAKLLDAFGEDLKLFIKQNVNLLLASDALILKELGGISAYLQAEQKEKAEQARTETVYKTFTFIGTLALHYNIKSLYQTSVVASSSYTINKAKNSLTSLLKSFKKDNLYQSLFSSLLNFDNFVSLLDPVVTIGQAVMNIVKLFHQQQSIEEILLEQVRHVIIQLEALSQELKEIAGELHQHIEYLIHEMQSLFRYDFFLSRHIILKIDDLQYDFVFLANLLQINFQSLFTQELFTAMNYCEFYRIESEFGVMPEVEYVKNISLFKQWLESGCKSAIMTGSNLTKSLELSASADKQNSELMIIRNIFKQATQDSNYLNYIPNTFLRYGAHLLDYYTNNADDKDKANFAEHATHLRSYSDKLFNISIWLVVLRAYLDLKSFFYVVYKYDLREFNIQKTLLNMSGWFEFIRYIQTTPELVQAIKYQINHLLVDITEAYGASIEKANTRYLFQDLQTIFTNLKKQQEDSSKSLLNPETTQLKSAYHDKAKVQVTDHKDKHKKNEDKFIDIVANFNDNQMLLNTLHVKKIRVPEVYLLAQDLQLGFFKIIFYESVLATHHGTHISMDGDRYGAEIWFVATNGINYQISEATAGVPATWNLAHDNGPVLKALFQQQVFPRTKFVNHQLDAFKGFVFERLLSKKRTFIQSFLQDENFTTAYEKLRTNLAFYRLFMRLIGMPKPIFDKVSAMLDDASLDLNTHFQALADNDDTHMIPAILPGILNINQNLAIQTALIKILADARNNDHFRRIYFQSPVLPELFSGASLIYQYGLQILQTYAVETNLIKILYEQYQFMLGEKSTVAILHSDNLASTKILIQLERPNEIETNIIYLYISQNSKLENEIHYIYSVANNNPKAKNKVIKGNLGVCDQFGIDIQSITSEPQDIESLIGKLQRDIIANKIIEQTNDEYLKGYEHTILAMLAEEELDDPDVPYCNADESICLPKDKEAHLKTIGVMNVPKNYHVVFTANTNPYLITEQKSTIPIPSYGTGNKHIPLFSGQVSEFNRITFSSETLTSSQFKPSDPTNSLIPHEQVLEAAGLFKIPVGYKVLFTESAVSNEIAEVNNAVKMTASGSSYSARTGHVHINSQGNTKPFARCVLTSNKAANIANVPPSDNDSPMLKAMHDNGFFNIPNGYHVVAISASVTGLPFLKEESTPVDCIASGNNGLDLGITAKGKTDAFPRAVLASAQISAPVDNAQTSQIFVSKPQEKVALKESSILEVKTELPEVFISYNKKIVSPQIYKVEQLNSTKPITTQQGWNCFDLAVGGLDRNAFVRYAIDHAQEEEFRQLLASEIRHAVALTAIFMGMKEQDELEKIKKILELFPIVAALKGTEDEEQVNKAIANIINTKNPMSEELRPQCLPQSMHTQEVKKLINDYTNAHENMRAAVAQCSRLLGRREGSYSLEEVDKFFEEEKNRKQHEKVYLLFSAQRQKIFTPCEQALAAYCMNIAIYKQYVNDYYGKQGWFALQRSFKDEKAKTSMIDIAAKYLSNEIIIEQDTQEIYRTKAYGPETIRVQYEGNIHFSSGNVVADKKIERISLPERSIHCYRKAKSKMREGKYQQALTLFGEAKDNLVLSTNTSNQEQNNFFEKRSKKIKKHTKYCKSKLFPIPEDKLDDNEGKKQPLQRQKNTEIPVKFSEVWNQFQEFLKIGDCNNIYGLGLLPNECIISMVYYRGLIFKVINQSTGEHGHSFDLYAYAKDKFEIKDTCLSGGSHTKNNFAVLSKGKVMIGLTVRFESARNQTQFDTILAIWNSVTGECEKITSTPGHVKQLIKLNDTQVISGGEGLRKWNSDTLESSQITLPFTGMSITALGVLRNGCLIAAGEIVTRVGINRSVSALLVSDDASGAAKIVVNNLNWITALVVLQNGKVVTASCDRSQRDLTTIMVFNPDDHWQCEHSFAVGEGIVYVFEAISNEHVIFVLGTDTCIWNLEKETCEHRTQNDNDHRSTCLLALPNGQVITGDMDGAIRIRQVPQLNITHEASNISPRFI